MSLKYVLLSSLHSQSKTGYELAKLYDLSAANFWQASHQQIYRELKKMRAEGLISCCEQKQQGKPDKKPYKMTELGQQALIKWLDKPASEKIINSPLLAKFMAGDFANCAVLLADVLRHYPQHQQCLAVLKNIEAEEFSQPAHLPAAAKLAYMCLRRGILGETMWLAWADEVIPQLTELSE